MATYRIFRGGPGSDNGGKGMYPSAVVTATTDLGTFNGTRGTPENANTCYVDFRMEHRFATSPKPLQEFFAGLPPLAANDIIECALVPKRHRFNHLTYGVDSPLTGLTYRIVEKFTGQILVASVNAATVNSSTVDITTAANKWSDTSNQIIQIELVTVPAGGLVNTTAAFWLAAGTFNPLTVE